LQRLRPAILYLLYLGGATLLLLLLIELGLRAAGRPHGLFHFRPTDNTSLYRPNTVLDMVWAPIPYSIHSNSLGFRGPEFSRAKPAGTYRIAAVGDSITDGFYVEDSETYPRQLEALLQGDAPVEVINAARGDSSIDREFEIIRRYVTPLAPDLVVIVCLSNDIDNLRGKRREDLLRDSTFTPDAAETSELLLFARTAIGELLLDNALKWRYDKYRAGRSGLGREIPAGAGTTDFLANSEHFINAYARKTDGLILYDQFNAEQSACIEDYFHVLEALSAYLAERNIQFLLAYYPEYPELYDPRRNFPLGDILQVGCTARGVEYLDLRPAFRAQPAGSVLHFAPLDFHPNAAGNRVIAEAIAAHIRMKGWLPPQK